MCLLVVCAILLYAWIIDKCIEAVLLIITFVSLRYKFDTTYHSSNTFICIFITLGVAYLSIPIVLPINISILFGIPIAFIITYFAWMSQAYINSLTTKNHLESEIKDLRSQIYVKDIYTMNEVQLRQLCKSKFMDEIDEEIAVQRLVYKLKGGELYSKIGYSKAQMTRREKRIESILGIKLK